MDRRVVTTIAVGALLVAGVGYLVRLSVQQ